MSVFVTLEVTLVLPRLTSCCGSGVESSCPGFRILARAARILPTAAHGMLIGFCWRPIALLRILMRNVAHVFC